MIKNYYLNPFLPPYHAKKEYCKNSCDQQKGQICQMNYVGIFIRMTLVLVVIVYQWLKEAAIPCYYWEDGNDHW
jgi:hypothetical protein